MVNRNLLPLHKLTRLDSPNGRQYITPVGQFESVTTFLGRNKKEALEEWKKAVGETEAFSVSNRAANHGTIFHSLCEDYLNNKEVKPLNILQKDLWKRFTKVISKVDNIRGIEIPLYSKTLRLAGTCDCIAEYDGVLSILDWKTSARRKSFEEIENYRIQCYIYKLMVKEMYGININQLVIPIAVEMEEPSVFVVREFNEIRSKLKDLLLIRKSEELEIKYGTNSKRK